MNCQTLNVKFQITVFSSPPGPLSSRRGGTGGRGVKGVRLFFGICFLVFTIFLPLQSSTQSTWYKYPGNIAFESGSKGEWDENTFDHAILFENNEYHMWYLGWSTVQQARARLGFATSPDGIHWEKHPGNPLEFDVDGFDWAAKFWTFNVIRKDSLYLMWYTAETHDPYSGFKIGFAWSADGLTWNSHPEPVLNPGLGDAWDGYGVTNPNVIFDGKIYHMWYSGFPNRIPKIISVGYATSTDGIHWTKHPANPVLKHGKPGSWDDHWVVGYSVTTSGPLKEIWYFGYNQIKFEIGLATSTDGVHWTKAPDNPIMKAGKMGEWDAVLFAPRVLKKDSIYQMWYLGFTRGGYATTSRSEAERWDRENIPIPQRIVYVEVFNRLEVINIDSLFLVLPELSGTALIDAYNKLALAYSLNDDVKSYQYAEMALELAKRENYPAGRAMALFSMGNNQYVLNKYEEALVNQLTALRLFDSLNMQQEVGNLLSQIASIHTYAGSHELACKYHQMAVDVFKQLEDTISTVNALNYLGEAFLDAEDTINARRSFEEELFLARASGQALAPVYAYAGLGKTYQRYLLDSTIYFIEEARKICESNLYFPVTPLSLFLAETYLESGSEYYAEAEECLQVSYNQLIMGMGDATNQMRWLYMMSELLISTGRYDEAKEYLDLSLELCQTFLSKHDVQVYGSLNEKLELGVLLKEYMEKIYRLYCKLDVVFKDKNAELQHFKLATAWKDSVSNEQAWKKVAMIQGNHEMEISRNKISLLEKENEVQILTLRRSRVYLYGLGVLVLILILGAVIIIRNRKIRAQYALELERVKSEKLLELDRLKSEFFANISHEFRTPLTLIMGPLEKVLSKTSDNSDKKELGVAKKYAGKLQDLIDNLLAISKLESGKMSLHASEMDIVKLVRIYLQAFESLAKQRNIDLKYTSEKNEIKAFIDREKFEQVLNNLLSNAFKYTPQGGSIEVKVSCQQSAVSSRFTNDQRLKTNDLFANSAIISVSDTGPGISPTHLTHIFDRFYQADNGNGSSYHGTGIGLALTKELVELHHGEIHVESEVGRGTIFRVYLPLGSEHLAEEERRRGGEEEKDLSSQFAVPGSQSTSPPVPLSNLERGNRGPGGKGGEAPLLLIVEDNADMRSYIKGYFENEFHIIEANDGVEGYEKSTEHIPDIIISDVMMPNMDGIEFCEKIKKDERTSHIPVILLTARASKESRMEGLETGADDFITKPFDGDELQVRVKNLINQRMRLSAVLERKIQKNYPDSKPDFEDSGITSMDERFLQNVFNVVEEHYADPQFNVDAFSKAVGLSKMQLHRKISALTRHSPGEFIRTYRLNVAAQLVKKQSGTIAEIAYDVGFNSPSYFAECFRKQFGLPPSEYK
jgi:signal transduction histidine kinase/DNA-binding response OmpR family regulator/predicted GH43/DUF377 family glycosyl hydrolase